MEHIPAYIFDWIELKPFDALSLKQQKEVAKHMDEEEYTQLHQAAIVASTYSKQNEAKTVATSSTLEHLNTIFDKHYPPQKKQLQPLVVWKIAASFLLLAAAVFSFGWYKAQHQKPEVVTHIITDTVFVDRAKTVPNQAKVYDTVYIERPSNSGSRKLNSTPPKYIRDPFNYREELLQENPLNSIPFSDKDQPQNRPKNNSIKDDTLIQNFDFVQL